MLFIEFMSMLMRYFLVYIFLFFGKVISAQSLKSSHFAGSNHLIAHRLILNSDSTFKYVITGDLVKAETQGKWYVEKKKIYLNSFASYRTGKSKIIAQNEECVADSGFYFMEFKTNDNLPLSYAKIYYDGEEYTASSTGTVHVRKKNVTRFEVEFLGDRHELSLKNTGRCVTVLFYQTDHSIFYLDNIKWDFHKRKIKISPGIILRKQQI